MRRSLAIGWAALLVGLGVGFFSLLQGTLGETTLYDAPGCILALALVVFAAVFSTVSDKVQSTQRLVLVTIATLSGVLFIVGAVWLSTYWGFA